jgi:uncharacterized GH25 family protein
MLVLFILFFATTLRAHDMWIEPATFSPTPGELVSVKLRVGQDLLGDPLPRSAALFKQFFVEDATGRKELVGREGGNPAGFLRVASPGLLIIGYNSNPSAVELDAEKFNWYLKEEGLDAVAALRATRNQTGMKAHELFVRCAKSLIYSASPAKPQNDRPLGFPLELVSERNPYTLSPIEDIPVRLTFENRPLPGALVVAINKLNPTEKLTARTGKDGRVRLKLRPGGMWLVKAVHMTPAPAGSNAEWMSYWASLTFEMKQRN